MRNIHTIVGISNRADRADRRKCSGSDGRNGCCRETDVEEPVTAETFVNELSAGTVAAVPNAAPADEAEEASLTVIMTLQQSSGDIKDVYIDNTEDKSVSYVTGGAQSL